MPATWEHRATGQGNDAGKSFLYQWIGVEDLDMVDEEFRTTITPENIPELFEHKPVCLKGWKPLFKTT